MNKITSWSGKMKWVKLSVFCLSILLFQTNIMAQDAAEPNIAEGEKLFKANCAACHSVGEGTVVGPGLKGINDKREMEWLVKWITNSQALIASGDADAIEIYEQFNKQIMPPQPVTPAQIGDILAYIQNPPVKEDKAGAEMAEVAGGGEKKSPLRKYVIIGLALFLLGFMFFLNGQRVVIAHKLAQQNGEEFDGPVSLIEAIRFTFRNNKGFVAAGVIILFFTILIQLLDGALAVGVHQDYAPEQPIKFSHKIHAGDDKIDCNYCHSSARHSKTSGIPSLNVCMNCHKYIKGDHGKTFMYDGEEYSMEEEIQKIYKHLDYDPATQTYGDNPTPVKWVKVHNLPDHVFFSHAQHVTAGKQKCQTCHGPVEEMEVLKQQEPLTMGWCVNCHRETKVSTEGNGYYEDLHSRMPEDHMENLMEDGKITVNEIGGLECAKCHY